MIFYCSVMPNGNIEGYQFKDGKFETSDEAAISKLKHLCIVSYDNNTAPMNIKNTDSHSINSNKDKNKIKKSEASPTKLDGDGVNDGVSNK